MKLPKDGIQSLRSLQLHIFYLGKLWFCKIQEAPATSHRQVLYVVDILYTLSVDWQAAAFTG